MTIEIILNVLYIIQYGHSIDFHWWNLLLLLSGVPAGGYYPPFGDPAFTNRFYAVALLPAGQHTLPRYMARQGMARTPVLRAIGCFLLPFPYSGQIERII